MIQYADFTVTVTALDINGNAAVGYTGTLNVTKDTYSIDDSFPSEIAFSASNGMGIMTIDLVFGVQGSLTFWDPNSSILSYSTGTIYFAY